MLNYRVIFLVHSKSVLDHLNFKPHQLLITGVLTKLKDEVKLVSAASLGIKLDVTLLNHISVERLVNRTHGRHLQMLNKSSWKQTSRSNTKNSLRPQITSQCETFFHLLATHHILNATVRLLRQTRIKTGTNHQYGQNQIDTAT